MINYKVDKEKGTVVAELKEVMYDAIFEVLSGENDGKMGILLSDEYVGKARCCPEDEFDEDFGKTLAKNRCLSQYYDDKFDELIRISEEYERLSKKALELAIKARKEYNKYAD